MDELEDAVRRQLYRMRDLSDGMAAIRVRETSPDGTVTAEVDANGSLLNLELSEYISRLSPAEFEKTLVDTAMNAARRAFAERAELVEAFNEEIKAT
jgi:DNA-binding protein YbaB